MKSGDFAERSRRTRRKEGQGDIWTWIAITDQKLIISYRVGARSGAMAHAFVADLADRLSTRVQLSTDGLGWYRAAVERAFGWGGCDYAMLNKTYGSTELAPGRYSPAECTGATRDWVMGNPDMDKVCTSHVERTNLTLRMQSRRMTRLTNGFSKAAEFHLYATALHMTWYNWIRPHQTLSKAAGKPTTPAMASGLAVKPWSFSDLLDLLRGE